jgi:xylan 1,4-beta-xylosidase
MRTAAIFFCLLFVAPRPLNAQEAVSIQASFDHPQGTLPPIWDFFGYDEPNYTYAPNGQKLLQEIAALSPNSAYIRTHNLLTTGNGDASLKWGSTNAYTEDAQGRPIYSWTIIDRIFDTYRDAGVKPLVEIGFMPEALSTHPEPYRHNFPQGSIYTGWTYPPMDYQKWAELVFQFTRHLRQRYGDAEVKTWLWEVWNEPDIDYWKGTLEEYFELYDYTVDAVLRAFPQARIGGPDSTGPAYPKAAAFLRAFLDHCAHGKNYVTGKTGSHLDFISYHPKGSPQWMGDHVQMGIARQLQSIDEGFKIVESFPEWRTTPIILGESDPEGCAACSTKDNPQNSYRNGPGFPTYTAETLSNLLALIEQERVNFRGSVTWSFEFEGQPPFEGFRELSTDGIDKPLLNAFRMFGLLGGERVQTSSSAALPTDQVLREGVRSQPDINAIATRRDREIEILVWNYHDDDLRAAPAPVELTVAGLPRTVEHVQLEHFRIDSTHSNAFSAWKNMGSPASPSTEQCAELERAGQLQLLTSPGWIPIHSSRAQLKFLLPRQAMSLVRLSW